MSSLSDGGLGTPVAAGGGGGDVTASQITDASANGRSLITAADYAAMRTLLSLVPGTNVQAYSAVLLALAGASANGQSLVTAADYAAMRILLGLVIGTNVQAYDANTAKTNAVQTYSKQQNPSVATLTSSAASIAWNLNDAQSAVHTFTEDTTLANPTNMVDGATYVLRLTQHASSPKTLAFGNAYKWPGGVAPTISNTNGAIDVLTFTSNGTHMYGNIQKAFA